MLTMVKVGVVVVVIVEVVVVVVVVELCDVKTTVGVTTIKIIRRKYYVKY